ncbi:MAG: ROK family protein [Candidatus Bathyarchaeota archaeon]|nr:MAG: ROK family protein [Candidatus Bathyarchaeota archaeon]
MSYVAVDIGATNVRVASADKDGISRKLSEVTDRDNGAIGVSQQIVRMISSLGLYEISTIGVGSIGPVDLASGIIVNTPNFPFERVPVVEPLNEAFDVPVRMLNDCAAAVLGEHTFGAGRGVDNLAYVTFSTGLGGGAIVDGHLLVGKDGNAVEIGHLTIDPHSPLVCGCGCRGHWEAHSSGDNLPNFVRLYLREEDESSLITELAGSDRDAITAEILFRAAQEGDPTALRIVSQLGEVNAIGVANVVNAFDPEVVTIGGSIALENPDLILNPILENIDRHLINRRPEIMITPLGSDAVLYGALALAISPPEIFV